MKENQLLLDTLMDIMLARWQTLNNVSTHDYKKDGASTSSTAIYLLKAVRKIHRPDEFSKEVDELYKIAPLAANRLNLATEYLKQIRENISKGNISFAAELAQKLAQSLISMADGANQGLSLADRYTLKTLWPNLIRRLILQNKVQIYLRDEKLPKQICMILGMHRSGTSGLANLLCEYGFGPPKDLMSPGEDNPRGYWESDGITMLNVKLLSSLGTDWTYQRRLQSDWMDRPTSQKWAANQLNQWTKSFQPDTIAVVKDPRLCLLIQGLEPIVESESIDFHFVTLIRNPLEVARSLIKREHFPITYERALRLWCISVLNANLYTLNRRRSVIPFEQLLEDQASVLRSIGTDMGLDKTFIKNLNKEPKVIDPTLWHNRENRATRTHESSKSTYFHLEEVALEIYDFIRQSSMNAEPSKLPLTHMALFGVG